MFLLNTYVQGYRLPPKTLSLTYDDGPGTTAAAGGSGPRTDDLGYFLFLNGIQATFFVIGNRAKTNSSLLTRLVRWGHLVCNHSYDHGPFDTLSGQPVLNEVLLCDKVIAPVLNPEARLFRPPYGAWTASAAITLNKNAEARRYTGPVGWDIPGGDWEEWKDKKPIEHCVDRYLEQINKTGRGVVLLHDSTADPDSPADNNTYEMTRALIPLLIAQGYRFVRLDAVPDVRSAFLVSSSVTLADSSGQFASADGGGGGLIHFNGTAVGPWEEFGIVKRDTGYASFRTAVGLFLSAQNGGGGSILANGEGPYDWERFKVKSEGGSNVILTTATGHFVTVSNGELRADGVAATTLSLVNRA